MFFVQLAYFFSVEPGPHRRVFGYQIAAVAFYRPNVLRIMQLQLHSTEGSTFNKTTWCPERNKPWYLVQFCSSNKPRRILAKFHINNKHVIANSHVSVESVNTNNNHSGFNSEVTPKCEVSSIRQPHGHVTLAPCPFSCLGTSI